MGRRAFVEPGVPAGVSSLALRSAGKAPATAATLALRGVWRGLGVMVAARAQWACRGKNLAFLGVCKIERMEGPFPVRF